MGVEPITLCHIPTPCVRSCRTGDHDVHPIDPELTAAVETVIAPSRSFSTFVSFETRSIHPVDPVRNFQMQRSP